MGDLAKEFNLGMTSPILLVLGFLGQLNKKALRAAIFGIFNITKLTKNKYELREITITKLTMKLKLRQMLK